MKMKTQAENKQESAKLTLTEQQIADFTRLAELQKDGEANSADRKFITDAYKKFAIDNHDALSANGGIRSGNLRIWIEVKRTLRAEIV